MEAGIAGIGDIAVGVDAEGGGLAGAAGGFGGGLQAARQTIDTASPRILPLVAFIRAAPLAWILIAIEVDYSAHRVQAVHGGAAVKPGCKRPSRPALRAF